MSALAERLRNLQKQAGRTVGAAEAANAPGRSPREEPPREEPSREEPSRLSPLPRTGAEPHRNVGPLPESIRRLLGIRTRALAPPLPRGPVDRTLPGDDLAPGVRYRELHVDWLAAPATLDVSYARHFDTIAPTDVLAFDTETTGLAGGAGTRAFMIGAADWLDGTTLRIRQLFLTELRGEAAMLDAFASWLAPSTVLVSYNGRCYDAPLLEARFRLARRRSPLPALRHLDLLFPTRRRYKGRWENCRLATIERRVLEVVREDDLPGAEAPRAWLDWLRGGDARDLRRVLAHNDQDVRSLVRLLLHLSQAPQPTL